MSAAPDFPLEEGPERAKRDAEFWSNCAKIALVLFVLFLIFRRMGPGGAGYR